MMIGIVVDARAQQRCGCTRVVGVIAVAMSVAGLRAITCLLVLSVAWLAIVRASVLCATWDARRVVHVPCVSARLPGAIPR
jgi:hypothetical protein